MNPLPSSIFHFPFRPGEACSMWRTAALAAGLALAGCSPKVQLTTPEPLKVDINMTVDVYQKGAATTAQEKATVEEAIALRRHEDRSGEIWAMKNDGVAIETEKGYLEGRELSGWDPIYVNRLVSEENADRKLLYQKEARESSRPVATIEMEAGKRLRHQAYSHQTESKPPPAKP